VRRLGSVRALLDKLAERVTCTLIELLTLRSPVLPADFAADDESDDEEPRS